MKILTKRNATLGWATWKTAKGVAKYEKAKKAIPTPAAKAKKTSKKKKASGRDSSRRRCGLGRLRAT